MRQEVHEGEEHGEGFLNAHETVERPFPMILYDRLNHRRLSCQSAVSDNMLARVVAFSWACPEKEA